MSYPAHGVIIDVTAEKIVLHHSLLSRSLGASATTEIALDTIDELRVNKTSATGFGSLSLGSAGNIAFAPNQDPHRVARAIEAALKGEAPAAATTPYAGEEAAVGNPGLNFVAVDVETANDNWGSICQIGAVRYRDGQETASRSWLCAPPPGLEHFAEVNIAIHGITAADVEGAVPFATAAAELFDFIGSDVIVAHNVQFDSSALRNGLLAAGADIPTIALACSLALSRDASRQGVISVTNHKLPTVVNHLGGPSFTHHDATHDARAAGTIITGLAQRFGHTGGITDLFTKREFKLGRLQSSAILPVLRAHTAPTSGDDLGAGTDFRDSTRSAGTSKKPTSSNRTPWRAVATPDIIPDPNLDADPEGALYGQHVTLTGDFEPYDKGMLWQGIAERGGHIGKNVTKKTTLLIVGEWAKKTSKEKRAEELQKKGHSITFWSGAQLFSELELDAEPPF
ncbi:DNA polymerase III subunit epsilon [Corynebacterium macginleyi]|uniref:DNA polymerase III subunit epsilon n=1 Tax=Corynebacterium macginleyi TaxID=38290 RepID=A0ABS1Y583_9CORY|nr:exonuclease domain-containing protein [Corynebacterium macginleyi]MBK4137642.1 DNA polymerase III subunit epsilon [Corynebacterium macginleyi]MBK4139981.1 DNA polymerase III subunit epsilon [Corynebacterium macginleyi]MBK4141724.1 DNA polymerase III subunit epsilon [Corynebacterium macginleyi]MBK4143944.1 DNA polymerase III subunit epsilon [Corynebacterium macginleyi]MBK4151462.1 DNA polymerase III subunit epsilon [Corynebacterium macginleyi]